MIKIRTIHKQNQDKKDLERDRNKLAAEQAFRDWVLSIPLNKLIDELSYPSDFTFFKRKAILFDICPSRNTASIECPEHLLHEVERYFTGRAVRNYLAQALPKLAPASIIKVKYHEDTWWSQIRIYYKGEK